MVEDSGSDFQPISSSRKRHPSPISSNSRQLRATKRNKPSSISANSHPAESSCIDEILIKISDHSESAPTPETRASNITRSKRVIAARRGRDHEHLKTIIKHQPPVNYFDSHTYQAFRKKKDSEQRGEKSAKKSDTKGGPLAGKKSVQCVAENSTIQSEDDFSGQSSSTEENNHVREIDSAGKLFTQDILFTFSNLDSNRQQCR